VVSRDRLIGNSQIPNVHGTVFTSWRLVYQQGQARSSGIRRGLTVPRRSLDRSSSGKTGISCPNSRSRKQRTVFSAAVDRTAPNSRPRSQRGVDDRSLFRNPGKWSVPSGRTDTCESGALLVSSTARSYLLSVRWIVLA
jgi:hypothetical protein